MRLFPHTVYRHVIDQLQRKPGAFENYRYREEMFPGSCFRVAYDELKERHTQRVAVREYREILALAARDSEAAVTAALTEPCGREPITAKAIEELVCEQQLSSPITDVEIAAVDLASCDRLLSMEETMQCDREKASRLHRYLTDLHLPNIRRCYQEIAITARRDNWEYEIYLLELAEREREARHNARIARLLKNSKLPSEKNLKAFDRKRPPRKVDAHLSQLMKGNFLDRNENVLAFGNPGSGKTHPLCAIAQELIHQGRQVRFTPCHLLVQELLIAKRDLKPD